MKLTDSDLKSFKSYCFYCCVQTGGHLWLGKVTGECCIIIQSRGIVAIEQK